MKWQNLFFILFLFLLFGSCSNEHTQTESHEKAGVSETEIKIGSSAALSGHAGFLGLQYLHGALSFIKEVNVNGGVHGRQNKVPRGKPSRLCSPFALLKRGITLTFGDD